MTPHSEHQRKAVESVIRTVREWMESNLFFSGGRAALIRVDQNACWIRSARPSRSSKKQ